jgi:hypothetical protein
MTFGFSYLTLFLTYSCLRSIHVSMFIQYILILRRNPNPNPNPPYKPIRNQPPLSLHHNDTILLYLYTCNLHDSGIFSFLLSFLISFPVSPRLSMFLHPPIIPPREARQESSLTHFGGGGGYLLLSTVSCLLSVYSFVYLYTKRLCLCLCLCPCLCLGTGNKIGFQRNKTPDGY